MVLGRVSLALIRSLSDVAADELDEDTAEILSSIRRIEVASYRAGRGCVLADRTLSLSRRLASDGWRSMVATAEEGGERAWVFSREGDDGGVTGMLVVALDQTALEVVRLDGDIDQLLTAAVAGDPSTVLGLADDE
jgi:hypothetical protein